MNCSGSLRNSILAVVLLLGVQLAAVFVLLGDEFSYALDDAYIHLAVAENIAWGHYGVNLNEYSAPSSSVVWPLLLVPFHGFDGYGPLLLGVACCLFSAVVYWKVACLVFENDTDRSRTADVVALVLWLVVCTNLTNLVLLGMEHSLQVLLAAVVVLGVIAESRDGRVAWWLPVAIIASPLVRYESLALAVPAIVYLFWRGHRRAAVVSLVAIVVSLGSFSLFLLELDLPPLPTSVLVKATDTPRGGPLMTIAYRVAASVLSTKGAVLMLALAALAAIALSRQRPQPERGVAACVAGAVALHAMSGQTSVYNRYEPYIYAAMLLTVFYLFRDPLTAFRRQRGKLQTWAFAAFFALAIFLPYIVDLVRVPAACRAIHNQQYQTHRFVVDYWKAPIAVNDLGWVSFRNDDYVLDLWGLASQDTFEARLDGRSSSDASAAWIERMMRQHDVRAAAVYREWFDGLPSNWQPVGTLSVLGRLTTLGGRDVTFYALDEATQRRMTEQFIQFEKTLPPGTVFRFAPPRQLSP